jgi:MFS family permease
LTVALRRATTSLQIPNYRRFFTGQIVSLIGNWMQIVAEMWLVVKLTGSGVSVGLTAGLQFLPILLFGTVGGVLADRHDKRRLLMVTQALMALPALTLFALAMSGSVQIWMVYALVLVRGTINAIDNPSRQALVSDLVGPDRIVNAVSLNSVIVHTARIVAVAGVGPCFLVNALSFGAMLVALRGMELPRHSQTHHVVKASGQVREAVREVLGRPELRIPLAMMVVIGTLSFNFQVLLPLFAKFTWDGNAGAYALLTSAMGVGSVAGALANGARGRVSPRLLVISATVFGAAQLAASAAPSLPAQALLLIPLGAASVTFAAGVNSSLQLAAPQELRGRIMSLYTVVFIGSTPIGAPLVGWMAQAFGPRTGMVLGGAAALITAAVAQIAWRRTESQETQVPHRVALGSADGGRSTLTGPWGSGPTKSSATARLTSGSTSRTSRLTRRRPRRPLPRRPAAEDGPSASSPRSSSARSRSRS